MKQSFARSNIKIKPSKLHGYGVFAEAGIAEGDIVEECPILHTPRTPIDNYAFYWDEHISAIALGFGSIYNHSTSPNCDYSKDETNRCLVFHALRDIKAGEELLINYGDGWFISRGIEPSNTIPSSFPQRSSRLQSSKSEVRGQDIVLLLILIFTFAFLWKW